MGRPCSCCNSCPTELAILVCVKGRTGSIYGFEAGGTGIPIIPQDTLIGVRVNGTLVAKLHFPQETQVINGVTFPAQVESCRSVLITTIPGLTPDLFGDEAPITRIGTLVYPLLHPTVSPCCLELSDNADQETDPPPDHSARVIHRNILGPNERNSISLETLAGYLAAPFSDSDFLFHNNIDPSTADGPTVTVKVQQLGSGGQPMGRLLQNYVHYSAANVRSFPAIVETEFTLDFCPCCPDALTFAITSNPPIAPGYTEPQNQGIWDAYLNDTLVGNLDFSNVTAQTGQKVVIFSTIPDFQNSPGAWGQPPYFPGTTTPVPYLNQQDQFFYIDPKIVLNEALSLPNSATSQYGPRNVVRFVLRADNAVAAGASGIGFNGFSFRGIRYACGYHSGNQLADVRTFSAPPNPGPWTGGAGSSLSFSFYSQLPCLRPCYGCAETGFDRDWKVSLNFTADPYGGSHLQALNRTYLLGPARTQPAAIPDGIAIYQENPIGCEWFVDKLINPVPWPLTDLGYSEGDPAVANVKHEAAIRVKVHFDPEQYLPCITVWLWERVMSNIESRVLYRKFSTIARYLIGDILPNGTIAGDVLNSFQISEANYCRRPRIFTFGWTGASNAFQVTHNFQQVMPFAPAIPGFVADYNITAQMVP